MIEIERKFLVKNKIPNLSNGVFILQAYIFDSDNKTFRVRIVENKCTIAIKINLDDMRREEYQYEIPFEEGKRLIAQGTTHAPLIKTRYYINYENMEWSIDFFKNDNNGLVIAEIELDHPKQKFLLPPWIGQEITYDKNYYNLNLYKKPYLSWLVNSNNY